MVDRRKAFSVISIRSHCQRSLPFQISSTLRAGFELAQNLRSGFVEWSCSVVITTTPPLGVILLLLIAITCSHYSKHRPKRHNNNIKMENNDFEKVRIKNRTCYYFDDIIKTEDFDFDNILIGEKSSGIILSYNFP